MRHKISQSVGIFIIVARNTHLRLKQYNNYKTRLTRVTVRTRVMAVIVSDYSCDLPQFNYFTNHIAKFSNQIANRIVMFQIKSLHLKSNRQNGSDRDLNTRS